MADPRRTALLRAPRLFLDFVLNKNMADSASYWPTPKYNIAWEEISNIKIIYPIASKEPPGLNFVMGRLFSQIVS